MPQPECDLQPGPRVAAEIALSQIYMPSRTGCSMVALCPQKRSGVRPVNAPFPMLSLADSLSFNPAAEFLSRLSVEITPRQIDKLPLIAGALAKGTRVY